MSKLSSKQLSNLLELKKEAGLLPDYLWVRQGDPMKTKTPANSNQKPSTGEAKTPPLQSQCISKAEGLIQVRAKIGDCTLCRLHQGRTNLVFGVGDVEAKLMFVGEGPGRDEDLQGEPFVGRAGQLLTKIIEAMGFKREQVYIANIVKCRPPENRTPAPDEMATCSPFLLEQIAIIRPKIIVCLGNVAVQTLLETQEGITRLRGRFQLWPSKTAVAMKNASIPAESIKLMPTYHPAFLLRNPNMKKPVWEDMQVVMKELLSA